MGEEVKMEVDGNGTLWLSMASEEESGGEQQGQESQSEEKS